MARLTQQSTADRLNQSAFRLFSRRGYRGTTMQQIAAGAGVTVGAIYNHVSSKQELLYAVLRRAHEEALARLEAAVAGTDDPAEALEAASRTHTLYHTDRVALVTVTYSQMPSLDGPHREAIVALRDRYERVFREIVESGVATGAFHVDQPHFAALAILGMGIQVSTWYKIGGRASGSDVADAYASYALRLVGYSGQLVGGLDARSATSASSAMGMTSMSTGMVSSAPRIQTKAGMSRSRARLTLAPPRSLSSPNSSSRLPLACSRLDRGADCRANESQS